MGQSGVSFDAFVREQERDPEFKALLDAERRRLAGEDDSGAGATVPSGPQPPAPTVGAVVRQPTPRGRSGA